MPADSNQTVCLHPVLALGLSNQQAVCKPVQIRAVFFGLLRRLAKQPAACLPAGPVRCIVFSLFIKESRSGLLMKGQPIIPAEDALVSTECRPAQQMLR